MARNQFQRLRKAPFDRYDRLGNEMYLDELNENTIRKDVIYACEGSLDEDVYQPDDEETIEILNHEKFFNHLSIA